MGGRKTDRETAKEDQNVKQRKYRHAERREQQSDSHTITAERIFRPGQQLT